MYDKLKESVLSSPVIDKNGYPYIVNPVTDGIPRMDPGILNEIIDWLVSVTGSDHDVILAPESMGIPLAVPLSLRTGIPYSVIRKRQYSLPGEIKVGSRTGYSSSDLFINGIDKGDKVILVDDVLSTGGTLSSLVSALKENGVIVKGAFIVFDKSTNRKELERKLGLEIHTMLGIGIRDGRPFCTDVY
jgi:adenine phosphoribosyltransferase